MTASVSETTAAPARTARREQASWQVALAPYAKPSAKRAVLDVVTSVVPYVGLTLLMYLTLDVSYLVVAALAVPAAGFLLRSFILFHDCAHGSFVPSRRLNIWLGRAFGLLVYSPYHKWRHEHAMHHASAGDLERRGVGDVPTLTVIEYAALPAHRRLGYRLFRSPVVMFGLGWLYALVVKPRLVARGESRRVRRSVLGTNVAVAVLAGLLCWLVGWREFLLVQGPTAFLAGSAGVWLFYVQHQFEDTYWQSSDAWTYVDAALRGSSYLKLPRVLQFFTGNIGLHHVHHLHPRIPNYNLQRAHDSDPIFQQVPTLTLWDGLRCVRYKLWDEASGRLVTFAEAGVRPVTGTG